MSTEKDTDFESKGLSLLKKGQRALSTWYSAVWG